MSESEKITNVVQRVAQPFRITLTRGQRGSYGWTIEVHAENRNAALYEIDQINDYLEGRYVNGQTRAGIPSGKAVEEPHARIENVKKAAAQAEAFFG